MLRQLCRARSGSRDQKTKHDIARQLWQATSRASGKREKHAPTPALALRGVLPRSPEKRAHLCTCCFPGDLLPTSAVKYLAPPFPDWGPCKRLKTFDFTFASKFGPSWAKLGRNRWQIGRRRTKSGPNAADVARSRTNWDPTLAEIRPTSPEAAHIWHNMVKHRPKSWTTCVLVGACCGICIVAALAQVGPNLAPNRPNLQNIGPKFGEIGRSPTLADWTKFGRRPYRFGPAIRPAPPSWSKLG